MENLDPVIPGRRSESGGEPAIHTPAAVVMDFGLPACEAPGMTSRATASAPAARA